MIRRTRLDHRVRSELRAERSEVIFLTFLTPGSWWPWLGVIRQDPAPAEITTTADTRTQGRQGREGETCNLPPTNTHTNQQSPSIIATLKLGHLYSESLELVQNLQPQAQTVSVAKV